MQRDPVFERRIQEYSLLLVPEHLLYFPVNALDSESVDVGNMSIVDALQAKFEEISTTNDWTAYYWAVEQACRTYQQDISFLMYFLMHAANRSVRKYLPNGEGQYPPITTAYEYDAKFLTLGSLSAVISYFTGQTKPNEHFERLFSPYSRVESYHKQQFGTFATHVLDDLVGFYNFPGMPLHFKQWLVDYIAQVKAILFAQTISELEYDHTPGVAKVDAEATL